MTARAISPIHPVQTTCRDGSLVSTCCVLTETAPGRAHSTIVFDASGDHDPAGEVMHVDLVDAMRHHARLVDQHGGAAQTPGQLVRHMRLAAGLSLDQLAERLQVNRMTLWKWEDGRTNVPAERLWRVAEACCYRVAAVPLVVGQD